MVFFYLPKKTICLTKQDSTVYPHNIQVWPGRGIKKSKKQTKLM